MRPEIREQCRNRWRSILPMAGVDAKFLTPKQGPCPVCEGRTRFRWHDKDGEGGFYCNHCGGGDGVRLVEIVNNENFTEAAARIRGVLGETEVCIRRPDQTIEQKRRALRRTWADSAPLRDGGPVAEYLRLRTGVSAAEGLRECRSLLHRPTGLSFPAMLALVRAADGAPINLHRTYLAHDGSAKAPVEKPRLVMQGELPDGCAVRLTPEAEVLGIAEGIETALCAIALFGIPTWAALTEGRLAVWEPPPVVRHVVIFGDADANAVGQCAAWTLAKRLMGRRNAITCEVRVPDALGEDWADVWSRHASFASLTDQATLT